MFMITTASRKTIPEPSATLFAENARIFTYGIFRDLLPFATFEVKPHHPASEELFKLDQGCDEWFDVTRPSTGLAKLFLGSPELLATVHVKSTNQHTRKIKDRFKLEATIIGRGRKPLSAYACAYTDRPAHIPMEAIRPDTLGKNLHKAIREYFADKGLQQYNS